MTAYEDQNRPGNSGGEIVMWAFMLAFVAGIPTAFMVAMNDEWSFLIPIVSGVVGLIALLGVITSGVRRGIRWAEYDREHQH